MENILVTGGAGFIGSNLAEKLLENGYAVTIVDNFNNFYDPAVKEKNIEGIRNCMKKFGIPDSRFKLYRQDIRDGKGLRELFEANSINMIVHLAAMAGVRPSMEEPGLYYDVNINGTLNLLEECRRNNVNKFIFASSSSVYGNSKSIPFRETDSTDSPVSPYGASKKSGELLCYTYHHLYGINVACLRLFTVYGPRQRPDLAIHKFARLISQGKPIPFYGEGDSARDYTYVEDITEGIARTIAWLKDCSCSYEVFNLGGSGPVSLIKMVETLESVMQIKAELCRKPFQPGDMNITCADITKARNVLGYNPRKDFRKGMEEFISWFREQETA